MHRCRAALAVLTLVLISSLAAGPARAGGPTSVLLVDPTTGESTSLYYSDDDYQALTALVGPDPGSDAAGQSEGTGSPHETGSGITVTWLIHDVSVWRVDRIHLDAEGGPWIATQQVSGDAALWDSPVTWHTSSDGKKLEALLARLGLGSGSAAGDAPVTADVAGNEKVAAPETPGSAAAAGAPVEEGRSLTGVLVWGLLGLALGVTGTVAMLRLVPGSRGRTGRTATAVDPLPVEDEPGWSSAERMSWPAGR